MDTDFAFETDSLTVGHVLKLVILFAGGVFSSTVGVGGGAFYTVAAIILFGLVYEAIPLSKVATLATAISYFLQNVLQPVPKESNHVYRFAYDIMMIMEPSTLLGTVFGVISSRIAPFWIISIFAVSLLATSANLTFKRAQIIREEELRNQYDESINLISKESINISNYGTLEDTTKTEMVNLKLGSILVNRSLLTIGICFCLVIMNSFVIEDIGGFSVECGGTVYFFSIFLHSLLICLLVRSNIIFLTNFQNNLKQNETKPFLTLKWDISSGYRIAAYCFLAGFVSSFCGVGGSTIKNPILLYLQINPTLAKATSQFMLLTTVGAAAIQFYFQGSIPRNFAILFFISSISSAVIGKTFIDTYVRRNHTQSTIVYLLAFYVSLSVVALGGIGLIIVIGQLSNANHIDWNQLWFRSPCSDIPLDMSALRLFSGGL